MNVMLTCAGRRNYLVKCFQDCLEGTGLVVAVDADPDAPALHEADLAEVVPSVYAPEYIATLVRLCKRHDVRLLFSLNDLELPSIARARDDFLAVGTRPVIPSTGVVELCLDKLASTEFIRSCGLHVPTTFVTVSSALEAVASGAASFPLILKPRWGTASLCIDVAADPEELRMLYSLTKSRLSKSIIAEASRADSERNVLIQQRINGPEYGLDVVNDLGGRYVTTFVKRKISMRAGETDRAVCIENPDLERIGRIIGSRLGHIGNLDCDIMEEKGEYYVLELNPRFGGGYAFSHAAGANLPAALIAWADGREPDPAWLRAAPNVRAAKCDRVVLTDWGVRRTFG